MTGERTRSEKWKKKAEIQKGFKLKTQGDSLAETGNRTNKKKIKFI